MITLLKLVVEGFCSIKSLELPLNQGCTVLIKAANGFGKSSIFSALVWGLYGKNLKGVSEVQTWEEYRPKDYKGVKVEIFFQNNSTLYKVIRCQNYTDNLDDGAKGKDRLLLYRDTDLINVKGKTKVQDELNKAIGLSYTLFMNSIMFGQGLKRLIQETNPDKKKIFEEIFDLDFINRARILAIDDKNHIYEEYREKDNKVRSLTGEKETLEETYTELRQQEKEAKSDKKDEIEATNKEIEKLRLQMKLAGFKPEDLTAAETKLKEVRRKRNEVGDIYKTSIEPLLDELYKLLKAGNTNKALSKVERLRTDFKTAHDLDAELEKAQSKVNTLLRSSREYNALSSRYESYKSKISRLESELKNLKSKNNKNLSSKYKDKIAKIEKTLTQLQGERDKLKAELDDYDWVINDPLGNQGIKAYLFESSMNMINEALDRYAETLGFRIEFSVDLDSSRKDFTTLIERDAHIIEYDELSGGEKQLVNIAMAFAMNEVLTSSRGINIAFLDEVFESLSSDNIEIVISLIQKLFNGKTLFLITHHDSLPLSKSKILQVEKHNGLSSYKIL